MSACRAALGHDQRGSSLDRLRDLVKPLDLADQPGAAGRDPRGIGARIAEREEHRLGRQRLVQHPIERRGILIQLPGDEAAADPLRCRRIGQPLRGQAPFAPGPVEFAITAADQAKCPRLGAGGGEFSAAGERHWGEHDWQIESPFARQPGLDCHVKSAPCR